MDTPETEKLRALLNGFSTACLVTRSDEGHLRARPMAIATVEPNCDLWFLTAEETAKVQEIESDPQVTVVCQNGWTSCVTISGSAQLVRDKKKVAELWSESFRDWFPKGAEDPSILLIHVTGDEAEFWDNSGVGTWTYRFQPTPGNLSSSTRTVRRGEEHGKVFL